MALGIEALRFTRDRLRDKGQPAELTEERDHYRLALRDLGIKLELVRESAMIKVTFGEGKPREFDMAKDRHIAPADVEEYMGRRSLELRARRVQGPALVSAPWSRRPPQQNER